MPRFELERIFSINDWALKAEENDPGIIDFLTHAVEVMDFEVCFSKKSEEATMLGKTVLSPVKMNHHLKMRLRKRGYTPFREPTFNSADPDFLRELRDASPSERRSIFKAAAEGTAFEGFQEADFLGHDNLLEVQLAKYAFAISDKDKATELVDRKISSTGAIILPMKSMQRFMSSGPAYYESVLGTFFRRRWDESIKIPFALIGLAVKSD
jgi:hypothetical protein